MLLMLVAAAHTYIWCIHNHTVQVQQQQCFKFCVCTVVHGLVGLRQTPQAQVARGKHT